MRASPGLLLPVEHKYLGNEAYNFGVALHRCELYREASSVLELACRELGAWCAGEETEEVRGEGRGEEREEGLH